MPELKSIVSYERNLLRQYKDTGDQELVGRLFNNYLHLVYGLCLKYLKDRAASQDAVMDIYELISKKLLEIEVTYFKSWLYMVSKNHCLMILRKNNPEVSAEVFMESPDSMHLKEEKIDLEKDLNSLEECIQKLKEEQKICVNSFFIENKSYQEIQEITGIDLKKVKSHIQNGKRNLKICLEGKDVRR